MCPVHAAFNNSRWAILLCSKKVLPNVSGMNAAQEALWEHTWEGLVLGWPQQTAGHEPS